MESLTAPTTPISAVRLTRHRLPLVQPLRLGSAAMHDRDLLVVRMTDARGAIGLGEIAPLRGFSMESMSEALAGATREARRLLDRTEDQSDVELPPSVRFGFELARADVRAAAAGRPLHRAIGARDGRIHVSGLLLGPPDEVLRRTEALVQDGYRTLKLKVGVAGAEVERALIRDVRTAAGSDVELRLDANRGWSFSDAVRCADAVLDARAAYVEEPLREPLRLAELVEITGMPIALDEGMREPPELRESGLAVARAAVIKPMLTGFDASLRIARELALRGVSPVLGGAFESGVGLRGLLALAACVPFADAAAGLDTYRWLARDVLRTPLEATGPRIDVDRLLAPGPTPALGDGEDVPL